jgi:hypothetical protein
MKELNKLWPLFVYVLSYAALILYCAMFLGGCSIDRQAQKREAWLIAHDKLDDICARVYPNMDSTIVIDRMDTLYKDGPEIYLKDTIYQQGDTVVKVITKKCPPVQVITKYRDSIIYRNNTAEEQRLKGEVLAKEAQIKAKDDTINKQQTKIDKEDWWKMACLITWFAIVLGIVTRLFIYKRPI